MAFLHQITEVDTVATYQHTTARGPCKLGKPTLLFNTFQATNYGAQILFPS